MLRSVKTIDELASLLGLTRRQLDYWAYVATENDKYIRFSIPKRTGGEREILKPTAVLLRAQRILARELLEIYRCPSNVHGFVRGRSIVSGAAQHTRQRWVIKVDLEDFFGTINFGRVRGVLKAKPINLPENVATVVAQLCCWDNQLPQGAPTSPALSNFVCLRLDSMLRRLARSHGCRVTRYADDITFSTSRRRCPEDIAVPIGSDYESVGIAGDRLVELIKSNGFTVNESKTRIFSRAHRQISTGLTVNEFPNVPRRYVREVRAMLHAARKHGIASAENRYYSKYRNRVANPHRSSPKFVDVLRGRIEYLRMVRGRDDPVFTKYAKAARRLDSALFPESLGSIEELERSLWVVEGDNVQGTGFLLEDVGFVTCQHVLDTNLHAFQPHGSHQPVPLTVLAEDEDLDLALLTGPFPANSKMLRAGNVQDLHREQRVLLTGFPSYAPGQIEPFLQWGYISALRTLAGVEYAFITSIISSGISGAPVVNENYEVIGVARTGLDHPVEAATKPTERHGVVIISQLYKMMEAQQVLA